MVFCDDFQCAATIIVTCRKPLISGLTFNYGEVCKGRASAWEAAVLPLNYARIPKDLADFPD